VDRHEEAMLGKQIEKARGKMDDRSPAESCILRRGTSPRNTFAYYSSPCRLWCNSLGDCTVLLGGSMVHLQGRNRISTLIKLRTERFQRKVPYSDVIGEA
jgi:hypothetical protein